ncbi:MAG: hypothetical protein JST23_03250, partial [Bacteroidetes bacterium]|nr:hypothetical protein [Bacteroidota bacterium]
CDWISNNCQLCTGHNISTYCLYDVQQGGDDGSGGGYEGEGSGAGGNGGSGSGGGTPPNCTPGHHRSAQYPPCEPGWIPEEDGGGANLPTNDSTIAAILKRLILKSGNTPDSIFTLAHAQTPTKEWVYSINVVRGNDTIVQYIKQGGNSDADAVIGLNTIAIVHVHNEDDANGGDKNSCISPGDIYKFYKNRVIDLYLYNYSIVITRDYYYAAIITDVTKFRDYIRSLCGTFVLKDINFKLEDLYKTGMTNCQSGCNWQKLTESGVLSLTNNNNSSISGIKIFRTLKSNVNFTLLTP